MDRFSTQQTFDRSLGQAVGAPADGLAQGMVYTAVIQSAIVEGMVAVSVPALHLSHTFQAHIKPDSNCAPGETCLIEYDEFKIPWVVTGSWSASALVTSLPAGPIDGQVINYLADAVGGVVWQLRYRAGSASAHKWEFFGGSDLYNYENPIEATHSHFAATGTTELAFSKPRLSLPLAGDYETLVTGTWVSRSASQTQLTAFTAGGTGGAGTVPFPGLAVLDVGSYKFVTVPDRRLGCLASEALFPVALTAASIEADVYAVSIRARPVRVG